MRPEISQYPSSLKSLSGNQLVELPGIFSNVPIQYREWILTPKALNHVFEYFINGKYEFELKRLKENSFSTCYQSIQMDIRQGVIQTVASLIFSLAELTVLFLMNNPSNGNEDKLNYVVQKELYLRHMLEQLFKK